MPDPTACPDCGKPLRVSCPSCQGRRGKGVTSPRKTASSRTNAQRARSALANTRAQHEEK